MTITTRTRRSARNWKRSIVALTCSIAALVSLAACGGQGASAGADSGAKTINIAVAANSKPLSYTDDSGQLAGYEVDVLKAIDKDLNDYTFKYEAVADDAETVGIDSGKYALITGGYFKTDERVKKYLIPDDTTGISLMKVYTLPSRTDIKSLEDLHGKKVAPISPDGGVNKLVTKYNAEHPDKAIDVTHQDNITMAANFQGLVDKKYDAVIEPEQSFDVNAIRKSLGVKFRATEPVEVDRQYFLVSKKQPEFFKELNTAITKLKDDGTLKQLAVKDYGEDVFKYDK